MAVELRDSEMLQVSFSVLESDKGTFVLRQLSGPENWWVGLEAVHQDVLLLHGYGNRQTGEKQGIWAYDAKKGDLLWYQENWRFQGEGEEFLVAKDPDHSSWPGLIGVCYRTGTLLHAQLEEQEARTAVEAASQRLANYYQTPVQYLPETPSFELLRDFLSRTDLEEPVRAIDYLEAGNMIFVGYYHLAPSGKMAQKLAIFNLQGTLLRQESLAEEVAGIGAEPFFVFRKKLFFLQYGKSLLSFVI
jgi:hypothetical protein